MGGLDFSPPLAYNIGKAPEYVKKEGDGLKIHRIIGGVMIALALASLVMVARDIVPHSGEAPTAAAAETEPPDTEPPEIQGVRDMVVGLFGAPAYRLGVSVTDNSGEADLEIDSSGVDTDVPGEYTVVYIARDAAGNETRAAARVYVADITEEALDKLADPILAKILLPGADEAENALAIHTWVKDNITYTNTGDKSSVLEGAYNGLVLRRGDCYTFYALAKYFLDRAGIESIDMARIPEAETRHYWLAVDLGEGWHHFDACPVLLGYDKYRPRSGFMITDGEAQEFAAARLDKPDYYTWDPACLPEGVEIVE